MKNKKDNTITDPFQSANHRKPLNFNQDKQDKPNNKDLQTLGPLFIQKLVSFAPQQNEAVEDTPNFNQFRKQSMLEAQINMASPCIVVNEERYTAQCRNRLLLNFEIKIGQQQYAFLNFFEKDSMHQVAYDFCLQYNLTGENVPIIEQSIQSNLEKLYNSKKRAKRNKNHMLEHYQEISEKKLSFVSQKPSTLVVDLEVEGNSQEIVLFPHQDPGQVAQDFCNKHNLGPEAKIYIQKILEDNLALLDDKLRILSQDEKEDYSNSIKDEVQYNHKFDLLNDRNNAGDEDRDKSLRDEVRGDMNLDLKDIRDPEKRNFSEKGDLSTPSSVRPKNGTNNTPGLKSKSHSVATIVESLDKSREGNDNSIQESYEKWHNVLKQKDIHKEQISEGSNSNFFLISKINFLFKGEYQPLKSLKFQIPEILERSTSKERTSAGCYYSLTSSRTRSETDIFNRLYYQGMKFKQRMTISQRERELMMERTKELTFHPQISLHASKTVRPVSADGNRFYDEMKRCQQKEILVLIEQEKAFREECPFTPTLSRLAQELSQNQTSISTQVSTYETVLERAAKRKARLGAIFNERYPFKPTLNPKTQKLFKKKQEFKSSLKEKNAEAQEKNIEPSKCTKNSNEQIIRKKESLKSKKTEKKNTKKEGNSNSSKSEISNISQTNKESLSSRSSQQKLKKEDNFLRNLFDDLDSDSAGMISQENINNCTTLAGKSKEILCKLFQGRKIMLSYDEFLGEMSKLNLVKALQEEVPQGHHKLKPSQQEQQKESKSSKIQEYTFASNKSDYNRLVQLCPRVGTLLKRFKDMSDSRNTKAELSSKEISSRSNSEVVDPTHAANKLTKHYSKLLMKSQDLKSNSFYLDLS